MPTSPAAPVFGIDLGTSNSAIACLLPGATEPRLLAIPQSGGPGATVAPDLLPSFFYHPRPDEVATLGAAPIPGTWARAAAARTPGRVTHAAKSWLCHRRADRTRPILPWGSDEVPPEERLSPLGASTALLRHLWQAAAAALPAGAPAPGVVLTVPASFAPDAQELTLAAAREAGLPADTRLLEEPQAVFYDWLARHEDGSALDQLIERHGEDGTLHLLVCDLGGGTSDFSLFTARRAAAPGELPALERIAVGEHLLLGGDNLDLALAHALEARLAGPALSPAAWGRLVAAARDLKEDALSAAPGDERPRTVALAAEGASLFAAARQVSLAPAEVRALVLDGFFPECPADAVPARAAPGLRELGLPYATDSAITRHLAAFVRDRPVHALLCNGGTLFPALLRERLRTLLSAWKGRPVVELHNPHPAHAVARGAAWFGARLAQGGGARIAHHTARSYWIEAGARGGTPMRLCLLPRGTPLDTSVTLAPPGLSARVNQPVVFRLSFRTREDPPPAAGDLSPAQPDDEALPPLTALLQIPPGAPLPPNGLLPVRLEAVTNALGLLRIRCLPRSAAPGYPAAWDLAFQLRPSEADPASGSNVAGSADDLSPTSDAANAPSALPALDRALRETFAPPASGSGARPPATASPAPHDDPRRLPARLETLAGQPRADWSPALLRGLWPALAATLTKRGRGPAHEAAWLGLAGYCLRPGFGWPHDEARVAELWRLRALGLAFPRDAAVVTQAFILWRRVAAGLSAAQQAELWEKWRHPLRSADAPPELVRAAASLERLPQNTRRELLARLLERLPRLPAAQLEPWIWALGRLLARVPLCGDPATVLPPDCLPPVLETLTKLKPGIHTPVAAAALVQALRCTGERSLDASPEVQAAARALLARWDATPAQLERISAPLVPDATVWQQLAGDRLPPGLHLSRS